MNDSNSSLQENEIHALIKDSFIHTNTMRSLELSKMNELKSTPTKSPFGDPSKGNGRMMILIHSNNSTHRGLPEDSMEVTLLPPATMDTPLATENSPP